MDAREADLWLKQKLAEKELVRWEAKQKARLEKRPMTDLEYRKLKSLSMYCVFNSGNPDKYFVYDMACKERGYPITENQAAYIERLWYRYRRQHTYQLPRAEAVLLIMIKHQILHDHFMRGLISADDIGSLLDECLVTLIATIDEDNKVRETVHIQADNRPSVARLG